MFQLIVAVDEEEIPRLLNLYERGKENGAKDLKLLEKHEIKDVEPNCEVRIRKLLYLFVYLTKNKQAKKNLKKLYVFARAFVRFTLHIPVLWTGARLLDHTARNFRSLGAM